MRCWRPRPPRRPAAQGKFWPMYDLLFRNQAHLKAADLQRYARELNLDMSRYVAEMDDHIYLQKVREHIASGRLSHIRATPAFFLNGVVQDISFGMKALHDAVRGRAVAASIKRAPLQGARMGNFCKRVARARRRRLEGARQAPDRAA